MKIRLLTIGKIKEAYLKSGIEDFLKRLKPYCNIEIIEVMDEPIPDNPKESEITLAKEKEGKEILKYLKDSDYLISLDLNKKQLKSEEFAAFLEKSFILGGSTINFVIGGSYGLSDELKRRANDSISLSNMTFTHQMTRLILLEQIYRGFKIIKHETYHK